MIFCMKFIHSYILTILLVFFLSSSNFPLKQRFILLHTRVYTFSISINAYVYVCLLTMYTEYYHPQSSDSNRTERNGPTEQNTIPVEIFRKFFSPNNIFIIINETEQKKCWWWRFNALRHLSSNTSTMLMRRTSGLL